MQLTKTVNQFETGLLALVPVQVGAGVADGE
jgi:hypothetical protein